MDFLYRDCNMRCDFCFERQSQFRSVCQSSSQITDSWITKHISTLKSVLDSHKDFAIKSLKLFGGQLLHKKGSVFLKIFKKIIDFASKEDLTDIKVMTNLVYQHYDELEEAIRYATSNLNETKLQINTSFDFGDLRFKSQSQLKLFKENIQRLIADQSLKSKICVNTIRTKPMLEALTGKAWSDQLQIFEELYRSSRVVLDANALTGDHECALSYEEQVQLWKTLFQKYPRALKIDCDLSSRRRACLDVQHVSVFGQKTFKSCDAFLSGELEEFSKPQRIMKMVSHYGCIQCKFLDSCPMRCPSQPFVQKCDLRDLLSMAQREE